MLGLKLGLNLGSVLSAANAAWYTLGKADDTDPSFWADFENNRYAVNGSEESFSDIFTFTRSTTGTRVNSSGLIETVAINQPRFDYDPVTLQPLGLLMEDQRTNNLTYSEDLSTWTTNGAATIASNVALSPTGTMTADRLQDAGTTTDFRRANTNTVSVTSSSGYTISHYVKADAYPYFYIRTDMINGVLQNIAFDLSTASVTYAGAGWTAIIENKGNGWYRVAAYAATASAGTRIFYASISNVAVTSDSISSYAGTTGSGVYIWGAQFESSGAVSPSSYIPTTGSAVTRTQDLCYSSSLNTIKVTDWFINSAYTVFDRVKAPYNSYQKPFSMGGGSGTIRNAVEPTGTSFFEHPTVSTSPDTNTSCRTLANYRQAMAIATNDASCAVEGYVDSTPDTSVTPSTGNNTLYIGSKETSGGGWEVLNGHIKEFRYYPIRVTNSELVRITT